MDINATLLGQMLDLHLLVTGVLVIALVLLAPNGILGLARRLRERWSGRS